MDKNVFIVIGGCYVLFEIDGKTFGDFFEKVVFLGIKWKYDFVIYLGMLKFDDKII